MGTDPGCGMGKVVTHRDLGVYCAAFEASMRVFELSKAFPAEERYSLTDQVRRSSRSVCANLAEGWRKRRYEGSFVAKLVDAEGEAAETQTWIEYAVRCGYMSRDDGSALYRSYNTILATLVTIRKHPEKWLVGPDPSAGSPR